MGFTPVKKVKKKKFVPVKKANAGQPSERHMGNVMDDVMSIDPNTPTGETTDANAFATVAEQFKDPRVGGATAGALYGVRHGPGGAILGATLGGMAGEGAKVGKEYLIDGKPVTLNQARDRVFAAGAKSVGEEVLGHGAAKFIGKVLYPMAGRLTEKGRIATKTLQKYMPKGQVGILPAESTEHWGLDFFHNIAEKSFFGGKVIADHKNIVRAGAVDRMVSDMVQQFGQTADANVLGNSVVDIIQGRWGRFKESIARPMYNRVGMRAKVVGGSHVNGKVEFEERPIEVSILSLKNAVKDKKTMKKLASEESGDNIVAAIRELPEEIDYQTALELRSRMRTISEKFGTDVTTKHAPAIGMAKHLEKLIDESVTKTLKRESPEAYKLWRTANYIYKNQLNRYQNKFIKQLVNQAENNPENLLRTVLKDGGVTGIQRVKNAIGMANWQKLKGWHVRQKLAKATGKDGVIDGLKLSKDLFSETGMGEQGMKLIYSPKEIKLLRNNAITMGVLNARQAKGAGGMMIQLAQPGALIGGATTGNWGPAVAVMVTPYVMGRMMLSPKFNRYLLKQGKLPKTAGVIGGATARLAGLAEEIERQITNEQEQ